MKIVMISNYFNHHQKPVCDRLSKICEGSFVFVATSKMTVERKKMGWQIEEVPEYVLDISGSVDKERQAVKLINEADALIWGDAPRKFVKKRIKSKKLIFRCSERIFKKGYSFKEYVPRAIKHFLLNNASKNQFLLCASAYAKSDYEDIGLYKNHALKWGYFPELYKYDSIDDMINKKDKKSIIWVSRLIPLKHPEAPLYVAKKLKEENIPFSLDIIGTGEMKVEIEKMIVSANLEKEVFLHGVMSPIEVRKMMEKSSIFLFTSDYQEGWGAVLNEAMNSGCAVVANDEIGSVPYLLSDGKNGYVYHNCNMDELYDRTKKILSNNELCHRLGKNAYNTLKNTWNAEIAAERLIKLVIEINSNNKFSSYTDGPCSYAHRVEDIRSNQQKNGENL